MSGLPAITIVIPAHNAARFVSETLANVLELDYEPARTELIVVDDGSTDETVGTVRRSLSACPFTWRIIEQPNAGPSRARNTGWQAASGEWIQFLDADDLLDRSKIRVQSAVAALAATDVAVIHSPWQRFSMQGTQRVSEGEVCVPQIASDALFDLLETRNFLQLGSQLVRRSWLAAVEGFNESYRLVEDVDLSLRIALAGGAFASAPSELPLAFYRQREGSLSRKHRRELVDACVRNATLAENERKRSGGSLSPSQIQVLTAVYGDALRFYFEADREAFRKLLTHILELDPAYRPGGRLLRLLTQLVGHEAAESLAHRYRRVRYRSRITGC